MTDIKWPDFLPTVRLAELTASRKSNVIRTENDSGPAKTRRRYTISTKTFAGNIIINATQRLQLEYWYKNAIADGALRFLLPDPQTLALAEFRFLEDYKEQSTDGLWKISMRLEKLNA